MRNDPGDIIPPDDTGSSTFQRFQYQAHAAFPFVLECGLGGEVVSVVLEHIDDLALEYKDRWRFIQLKTRDPELANWRLADLLSKKGALRGLYRSYIAVKDTPLATTHEVFLEGPVDRTDMITKLTTPEGRTDADLVSKIAGALHIDQGTCTEFLQRVRLKAGLPGRTVISAVNLRGLGSQAPELSQASLEGIYWNVVGHLDRAMAANLVDVPWCSILFEPDAVDAVARAVFDAKRLTRQMIVPLLGPVTGSVRPLLRRLTDADGPPPTVLEQKLLTGGATSEIVRHAQGLRANATILETEYLSSTLIEEGDHLEDIDERLLIVIDGLRAQHARADAPAALIWDGLVQRLPTLAESIDLRRVFRRDPYMLLGRVCDLADRCLTDWGVVRA